MNLISIIVIIIIKVVATTLMLISNHLICASDHHPHYQTERARTAPASLIAHSLTTHTNPVQSPHSQASPRPGSALSY